MDRQCIDIGPTIYRERPRVKLKMENENGKGKGGSRKYKDRFAQCRKNVRRGGLKDELFIGPKLPKIKENYTFTDYTN